MLLTNASLKSLAGGWVELRPAVTLSSAPGGGTSPCLANAEILDSFSGFSLVLAPGATTYPLTQLASYRRFLGGRFCA